MGSDGSHSGCWRARSVIQGLDEPSAIKDEERAELIAALSHAKEMVVSLLDVLDRMVDAPSKLAKEPPVTAGQPLWRLVKSGHVAEARVRAIDGVGLELRYE
jgi:hypothetical protein